MTTISGLPAAGVYGYGGSSVKTAGSSASAPAAAQDGVQAILGKGNASAPLTYNAAGLYAPSGQSALNRPQSAQSAQDAVLAAENTVTDTLSSLLAGSSSSSANSSALDIPALLGTPGGSTVGASGASAQSAQDTLTAVQDVVTRTLGSLGGNPASGTGN